MARNFFREDGFLVGAIGLGGEGVRVSAAMAGEIQLGTFEKGQGLARAVSAGLGGAPRALILYYDALSRVDVPQLLAGITQVLPTTVVVGGAAGQPWGPMVRTYQFLGKAVSSGSCVALGLDGPFEVLSGRTSGAVSAGIKMRVTRAEGTLILELDGRPALDVWLEMVGRPESTTNVDDSASWAVGLRTAHADAPVEGEESWTIMAAFGLDPARRGVFLQASVAEGTEVLFHHRTADAVVRGSEALGRRLRAQLGTRRPVAALGFECGARTGPFLGQEESERENRLLQEALAPDAAWLGMLAWGEVAPSPKTPSFCNYTFPVLLLTES
jgi:hypothetical protein